MVFTSLLRTSLPGADVEVLVGGWTLSTSGWRSGLCWPFIHAGSSVNDMYGWRQEILNLWH